MRNVVGIERNLATVTASIVLTSAARVLLDVERVLPACLEKCERFEEGKGPRRSEVLEKERQNIFILKDALTTREMSGTYGLDLALSRFQNVYRLVPEHLRMQ